MLADDGIKQAAAVTRNRVSAVDVPAGFPVRGGAARLKDRWAERAALDRLLDAVRAGKSRALVAFGAPGRARRRAAPAVRAAAGPAGDAAGAAA